MWYIEVQQFFTALHQMSLMYNANMKPHVHVIPQQNVTNFLSKLLQLKSTLTKLLVDIVTNIYYKLTSLPICVKSLPNFLWCVFLSFSVLLEHNLGNGMTRFHRSANRLWHLCCIDTWLMESVSVLVLYKLYHRFSPPTNTTVSVICRWFQEPECKNQGHKDMRTQGQKQRTEM
jgi:hypothetical protein